MNSFMNNLTKTTNFSVTENGALSRRTTRSAVLDMFALGGAYRQRSDSDCILLFKNALQENPSLAMKCLFYLRDIRGGQGERRFFRVCFNWLANSKDSEIAKRNLAYISEFGRYDDLFACIGTPLQDEMLEIVKKQIALDLTCKTPSLLAKWLPSENASANATKILGTKVRTYLGLTHREYRKMLSDLRSRINIVEKLMSQNRWDEIEFDKLPSKAGLIYKNAFARRDILAKKYETFAKDKTTKVNAATLYPYEIINKVLELTNDWRFNFRGTDTDRAMLEKYWENQIDVLQGKPCNMMCVVDTSGSMTGRYANAPINIAIGLGMYCAERAGGPFKDHYISFSSRPQLIRVEGTDFVDKVIRIYRTNLCENTNLEATFDLLYDVAKTARPEDIPEKIVVISDMEIDHMSGGYRAGKTWTETNSQTEMERIRAKWQAAGLQCPKLVYWNVNARNDRILDLGPDVSFVSGASPLIFKQVLSGKTGYDLMLEVLLADRYAVIQ